MSIKTLTLRVQTLGPRPWVARIRPNCQLEFINNWTIDEKGILSVELPDETADYKVCHGIKESVSPLFVKQSDGESWGADWWRGNHAWLPDFLPHPIDTLVRAPACKGGCNCFRCSAEAARASRYRR